jgi:DNA gyrase/topoisomerase IV subunit A
MTTSPLTALLLLRNSVRKMLSKRTGNFGELNPAAMRYAST